VGETKTFSIQATEAYGERRSEPMHKVPKAQLPAHPEGKDLAVGMQLGMKTPDGNTIPITISAVDADTITLDMNHPLAGKALTFTITILKIE